MGYATAGVTGRERQTGVDFALIGHQESWRVAADVLAVLRGTARARLPDDEIKEIFPGFRRAPFATSRSLRQRARKRTACISTPSFLPIAWVVITSAKTSAAYVPQRLMQSKLERRS